MKVARFALIVSLTGAVAIFGLPRDGIAAPVASRQMTFEDHRSGARITVETNTASPEAGRFAVSVPGRGTYLSVGNATVIERSGGREEDDEEREESGKAKILSLRYAGEIELVGPDSSTRLPGRLQGHIDLRHMTAQFSLWIGPGASNDEDAGEGRDEDAREGEDGDEDEDGRKITIVALRPSTAGLLDAARSFAGALLADDWGRVYDLASSDLRGDDTREEFILAATGQAVQSLSDVVIEQIGDPIVHPIGVTYAVVTLDVRRIDSTVTSYDAYFVREGTDWKLWFTAER